MVDYFRILNEQRRPWIAPDELKKKFLALSVRHHPDRQATTEGEQDFAVLNQAYNCLRDSPQRLAHLIELESSQKPGLVQSAPGAVMDLFFEAGSLLRECDKFLTEKARNSSPMVAVSHFARGMEYTDQLNGFQQKIAGQTAALDERLKALNDGWNTAALSAIYNEYAFLSRWRDQIQERISKLML